VTGRAFGRTLAHAGVERQGRIGTVGFLRLGWSLLVDAARPWQSLRAERVPWQVDGGAALRVAGWGTRDEFRITAAHGFEDGGSALSVGWEVR
jgi:hypothetical protein